MSAWNGETVAVPRHRGNGNPLVLLPEFAPNPDLAAILRKPTDDRTAAERAAIKGKSAYYSRASSAGKAIDNEVALTKWKLRMVAIGLAQRSDLLLNVAAHSVDASEHRRVLDGICQDAIEAARASTAANVGTALHKLTEYADQGIAVPGLPTEAARDLDAYNACKQRHGVTMAVAEQFVVNDELHVAGTLDRLMRVRHKTATYVGDIKTGNTTIVDGRPVLAFVNSMAVQLAVYANSQRYDPATGERTPLDVDRDVAIVIHLPQGTGECNLYWLNIAAGYEAARLADAARRWQDRRDLAAPIEVAA